MKDHVVSFLMASILVVASNSQSSVILFRPAAGDGSFGNYRNLPPGCGNRILAEYQDGFSYGLQGGPTPNITAQYNTGSMPNIRTWDNGFGNLTNVVTTGGDGALFEYDLIADSGFKVQLVSFDMATWVPDTPQAVINSLSVQDGQGTSLFYQTNVFIPGTGHFHFAFTNVAASVLRIMFDATDVDADDVGMTDVIISQIPAVQILSINQRTNNINIKWLAIAGQTNVVQGASTLGGNFTNISPQLIIQGNGVTQTNWIDVGAVTNSTKRFYRINYAP